LTSRPGALPTLPMPAYIEGRLLYDQGRYADALRLFEQALADLRKSGALQLTELHFYTADTLGRLERYPEAESQFIEELKYFPQNTRARAGLAMLYQANGRSDAGLESSWSSHSPSAPSSAPSEVIAGYITTRTMWNMVRPDFSTQRFGQRAPSLRVF